MARILLVDDDELLTEAMMACLTDAGHMVSAVHHGDEALRAIEGSIPDLLILDYNLPGMSGLSILRAVRRQSYANGMPIMMLTAKGGKLLAVRARHDGADDYLNKPVFPRMLLHRAEALLAGKTINRHAAANGPVAPRLA